jgi:hypothetical protein
MKNYNYSSYLKRVLVKGNVVYKNGSPIKNAIVFLEAFFPYKSYGLPVKFYKKYCGYTTTNCKGGFCYLICDIRCYYKIKVFDSKCNNVRNISNLRNVNYSIHLT